MNDPKKLASILASIFLFAHIGLIPFTLFVPKRFTLLDKYDVLLLIGPVTAAYFVSLTQYVIENRIVVEDKSGQANALYILFSSVLLISFFCGTYGSIVLAEIGANGFKPENVKVPISIAEIFIGGSFALVFKTLFPTEK